MSDSLQRPPATPRHGAWRALGACVLMALGTGLGASVLLAALVVGLAGAS